MVKLVPAALALSLGLAGACTSVVSVTDASSSGSGGSGGATTASSSSGSGASAGAGGTGGSLVSSSSSSSSNGSSGTGGVGNCAGVDTYLDVIGDGPTQHYTALCDGTYVLGNPTGPVGYHPTGGGFLDSLVITGCLSAAPDAPGLYLNESAPTAPGVDDKATATYGVFGQTVWQSMGAGEVTVTLTLAQEVGGVVEGNYVAVVASGVQTKMLSGTFRVCHVYDIPKP